MGLLARTALDMDIIGQHHLPPGPKILDANHPTTLDPFLLLTIAPDEHPDAALCRVTEAQHHLRAWSELLCLTAGLPPLPEGVVPLATRRSRAR